MDTFNFKRFFKTFRWYFRMKRDALLKWVGMAAVATVVVEMLLIMLSGMPYSMAVKTSFAICMSAFMIAFSVALSNIFADIRLKTKRTSLLMLPASKSEKYLCAFLYCSLIWPVATLVAFAAGDTLRMLLGALIWKYDMISNVSNLFGWLDNTKMGSDVMTLADVAGWTSLLWAHSLYVACGTWFKKVPYLIATAIGLTIFFTVSYYISRHLLNRETMMISFNETFKYGMIAFFVIAAVANYCLSYIKFKRFEVVSGNWLN